MRAKSVGCGKWAIAVVYMLLVGVAVALNTVIVVNNPTAVTGSGARIFVDDLIIPFGIFLIFTAAQTVLFYVFKNVKSPQFIVLLSLVAIKAVSVFMVEFILDFLNISYYSGSAYKIATSTLIIAFLVLVVLIAAVEIIVLIRLWRGQKSGKGVANDRV